MGNYVEPEYEPKNEELFRGAINVGEAVDPLKFKTAQKLEEMAEDDPDFEEDDEFMEKYHKERLKQMHKISNDRRFGFVKEIDKTQWEIEITRAPEETFVICVLYQDYD